MLHKTFITPLDPPEIEALISSLDDTVDLVHAAADTLLLYRIERPRPAARELAEMILAATKEIAAALAYLRDKKLLKQIMPRVLEINRLENEADRLGRAAMSELIASCENNMFELMRWKEVYEQLEAAADRCEDVADVLRTVVIKYA